MRAAAGDAPWLVRVGQRYRVSAETLHTSTGGRAQVTGTVIWVHPQGRYAMLLCRGPKGKNLAECYNRMELTRENRVK